MQLETPANAAVSKHIALQTDLLDGTSVPTLMPDGSQAYAIDDPHYLGPVIAATKDKPVRIVFYNLLPTGADGDLFLPVDSTPHGLGLWSHRSDGRPDGCRAPSWTTCATRSAASILRPTSASSDNRATLHLHGGITPWISDGTPHQWITPANETTAWPQGVSRGERARHDRRAGRAELLRGRRRMP